MLSKCSKENVEIVYPNIFMYRLVAPLDTMVQNYHSSINSSDYSYMKNSMSIFRYIYLVIFKKIIVAVTKNSAGKKLVLGYCVFDIRVKSGKKILLINSIGVDDKKRKIGIGKKIFEKVRKIATNKKIEKVELWVDTKNENAVYFYNSLGLSESKKKMELYIK